MIITGGVKRIVAVDDSNIVLKMLQNVLNKEEYDLHPFSTGKRALQYLMQKDNIPDLIILDIEMPEMNGYEVLERIKKVEHLENVPVIFLTANGEKKQVIKAVTGGVKDYVVKPIDKDVLTKKMRSLLNNQQADTVRSGVADTVRSGVADTVGGGVADTVGGGVANTVGSGVADTVEDGVADAVGGSIADAAEGGVADTAEDGMTDIVADTMEDGAEDIFADILANLFEDS